MGLFDPDDKNKDKDKELEKAIDKAAAIYQKKTPNGPDMTTPKPFQDKGDFKKGD